MFSVLTSLHSVQNVTLSAQNVTLSAQNVILLIIGRYYIFVTVVSALIWQCYLY